MLFSILELRQKEYILYPIEFNRWASSILSGNWRFNVSGKKIVENEAVKPNIPNIKNGKDLKVLSPFNKKFTIKTNKIDEII